MILPWLILIPFIGGFLCWLGERFGATLPRWIALLTMSLLLGIGLWLWGTGDYTLLPPRARTGLGPGIQSPVDPALRHQYPSGP